MNVKLVMYLKGQRQREIALKGTETVLGRQKGCAIRIASHEISRLHCCVRVHDGRVTVRDLGSANGTFVNNQQIKGEHLLRHGDKLQLADLTFVIEYAQGHEVLGGLPVGDFELVDDVVEGVVLVEEDTKQRPKAPQLKPAKAMVKPPPLPKAVAPKPVALPPGLEEVVDVLPDAVVEESFFKPTDSKSLPMAEVEQSARPLPSPPAAPALEERAPVVGPKTAPSEEDPWIPPWEEKPAN
jgi:predicted component of type VI protein secretion system